MSKGSILILSDEHMYRKLFSYYLRCNDYFLQSARDVDEAREHLLFLHINAILLHIYSNVPQQRNIIESLKKDPVTKDIPLIAMTNYAHEWDDLAAREAGLQGVIFLPVTRHDFCRYVEHVLTMGKRHFFYSLKG